MSANEPQSAAVSSKGFLLLDTAPTQLALPAENVLSVRRAIEWKGEPPLPFGTLLPIRFRVSEPEWVLRIGGASVPITALVSGAIRIAYHNSRNLLFMPIQTHLGFERFSKVVLADGKPSALVVNIDALHRVHRELDS